MSNEPLVRGLAARQHGLAHRRHSNSSASSRSARRHMVHRGDWRPATPTVLELDGTPRTELQPLMLAVLDARPRRRRLERERRRSLGPDGVRAPTRARHRCTGRVSPRASVRAIVHRPRTAAYRSTCSLLTGSPPRVRAERCSISPGRCTLVASSGRSTTCSRRGSRRSRFSTTCCVSWRRKAVQASLSCARCSTLVRSATSRRRADSKVASSSSHGTPAGGASSVRSIVGDEHSWLARVDFFGTGGTTHRRGAEQPLPQGAS